MPVRPTVPPATPSSAQPASLGPNSALTASAPLPSSSQTAPYSSAAASARGANQLSPFLSPQIARKTSQGADSSTPSPENAPIVYSANIFRTVFAKGCSTANNTLTTPAQNVKISSYLRVENACTVDNNVSKLTILQAAVWSVLQGMT